MEAQTYTYRHHLPLSYQLSKYSYKKVIQILLEEEKRNGPNYIERSTFIISSSYHMEEL